VLGSRVYKKLAAVRDSWVPAVRKFVGSVSEFRHDEKPARRRSMRQDIPVSAASGLRPAR